MNSLTVTIFSCSVNSTLVLRGVGEKFRSLYKADITSILAHDSNEVNFIESNDPLQLHENWGHHDKRHVKKLLERDLDIKVQLEDKICELFVYGKAHRLPFGTRKSADVIDLLKSHLKRDGI